MMVEKIEETLAELLSGVHPSILFDAMRHAVMSGGKRLRPRLCLLAANAVGGDEADALYPACAIELLHSYTLIHDDLPSMDGDTMRRGRPSVWAKFGEANAVLAGDALQSLAFSAAVRAPRNVGKVVSALAEAGVGVVRGQAAELNGAGDIDFMYRHKTADLFIAAAVMGALVGGGSEADVERLRTYALNLGLAFQHEDNLLDGDSPCSREEAGGKIADFTSKAISALGGLSGDIAPLVTLAEKLAVRSA